MSASRGTGHELPPALGEVTEDDSPNPWDGSGVAMDVTAYLLAGPMVLGIPAWFLDRRYHTPLVLALAILAGMAMSMYVIWLRYGKR